MRAARHDLASKAIAAWGRYASAVRTGGTPEQRRFAFDVAVKAEEKLAEHDLRVTVPERRKAAARALSGR